MTMLNQEILNKVYNYIDTNKDNIIHDLITLASIKSVSDKNAKIKPFGQGCLDALNHMLKLGETNRFVTQNFDNYVGKMTIPNNHKESIGIWAHLDVVPEGDDWMSEPYTPIIKDGCIFGRGVHDNKSGAIGGLYILKALSDLNIPTKHKIELFIGTSEETGMDDVKYYVNHYPVPKFSFVPDASFPGMCGEFGRLRYELKSRQRLSDNFVELSAGSVFNIIPNYAYAIIKDDYLDLNNISDEYVVTKYDGLVKIEAYGKSSHAAIPEYGINAIHKLTSLIKNLKGLNEQDKAIIEFIDNVNLDSYGTYLGIDKIDDISGQTVSSGTVLRLVDNYVAMLNDCRHAVSNTNEELMERIIKKCNEFDFDVKFVDISKPYYIDKQSDVVKLITEIYHERINDTSKTMVIGKGGSYAGKIPNSVATGIILHDGYTKPAYLKEGHGGIHQPDECMNIAGYIEGIKLFARMVLEVDDLL